jgi:hypothetical protein
VVRYFLVDLLSPATTWSSLGNTPAPLLYPCCHLVCYFGSLLEWRIGFGVMGMEPAGVMPAVQGFVRCDAGSMWLLMIPKSKDRFME